MVGLSIVLESQKGVSKKSPQVINKATLLKPSSRLKPFSTPPATTFLDHCFLCKHKLLPGKDIYMYKGDKGFCSVECRSRQIFMDEEESDIKRDNCSLAAMMTPSSSSSSSANRKGARNGANGFAC